MSLYLKICDCLWRRFVGGAEILQHCGTGNLFYYRGVRLMDTVEEVAGTSDTAPDEAIQTQKLPLGMKQEADSN